MVVLLKTLQVILALSILIVVHEFGHFFFARLFGIRVDKFYLFFDVGGKALFSTKKSRFVARHFPRLAASETDYGIGWLPLGGYCKIAGMVDESMDTEYMKTPPQPWEFRTKPAWQRLLVMAGGVLFNFILAIVLYIAILAAWGSSYLGNGDDTRIWAGELAEDMGFRTGDHIIGFDGDRTADFDRLQLDMARGRARTAEVVRGTDTLTLYLDQSRLPEVLQTPGMFGLALPFVVDTIPPVSPNYGCDLRRGDRIISLDGQPVRYVQDSRKLLGQYKGGRVEARYLRPRSEADAFDTLSVMLQVDSTGLLGIYSLMPPFETREYGFWEAIPAGFKLTFSTFGASCSPTSSCRFSILLFISSSWPHRVPPMMAATDSPTPSAAPSLSSPYSFVASPIWVIRFNAPVRLRAPNTPFRIPMARSFLLMFSYPPATFASNAPSSL